MAQHQNQNMMDIEEDKLDPDDLEEDQEAVEIMHKSQIKQSNYSKASGGIVNSVGNSPQPRRNTLQARSQMNEGGSAPGMKQHKFGLRDIGNTSG